jgi:hypothetical protein
MGQPGDLPLDHAGQRRVAEPNAVHPPIGYRGLAPSASLVDDSDGVHLNQVVGLRQRFHAHQGVGRLVVSE